MKRRLGFTLIELLVVIAIISILAAIVVPQVSHFIARGRMGRVQAEVANAELALTKMLTDADKKGFRDFFVHPNVVLPQLAAAITQYGSPDEAMTQISSVFYRLLRQGRNADFLGAELRPEVAERLGDNYMDIGNDPWAQRYRFFPGPWEPVTASPVPFRCYRIPRDANGNPVKDADLTGLWDDAQLYRWDLAHKALEDAKLPGNPAPDGAFGFPASTKMTVYIFSTGQDMVDSQLYNNFLNNAAGCPTSRAGGGDDVSNWDKNGGWARFYNQ